ncbi:hypothetical protein J2S43_005742 [Catenuloplanes nepalensis]|uniref:Uncharacterized protein n=1 Tax=Catenuloplanes nepalensis TaxID=587533 RepID=A0ABT9N0L2_9ACTN|nr:hypothetical protein [Catenuloplanes nepalensis]MDP9797230.1 hypothetical protein [Catenuloplanes nepalensis]
MTFRKVLLGAAGGAGVWVASWTIAIGVTGLMAATLWPDDPDASIGNGMVLLAVPLLTVPLLEWLLLRRLRVRGAGVFGLLALAAYFLSVQIGTEQSTWSVPLVVGVAGAVVFAAYTAIVTATSGPRHTAKPAAY